MIAKSLKLISLCLLIILSVTSVSWAEPVPLFSPYVGTTENQSGFGMACVEKYSSSSVKSDFLLGFPAFNGANFNGFAQIISGQDGSTLLLNSTENSRYGYSGASIGDVNNDGLEEVIVGDPETQFAYINSSVLNQITISSTSGGASPNSGFGHSVAGLYSVTTGSTGLTAIVGAPLHSDSSVTPLNDGLIAFFDSSTGVFVRNCRASLNSADKFGWALASIQDLNNDGIRDIVVGAPGATSGNGRVDILNSRSGCNVIRTVAGSFGAGLGTSVAAVGDQDNDGFEDFIAGGPTYSETILDRGIANLYSGATGNVLCSIKGTDASERLGESVSGIGDANYDGKSDFAVGSPGKNGTDGQVTGYAYSTSTSSCSEIFTIPGTKASEMGKSLAGSTRQTNICDMNSDGYPEFLVGTGINSPRVDSGSAILYSVPTPTPTPTVTPTPRPTKTPISTTKLPDRSRLTFRITESGTLSATNVLDRDPKDKCTVRLQVRYSNPDLTAVSSIRVLIKSKKSKQITKFQALNLPKVEMPQGASSPYILHMIARNTCGKKTFASNVFSRYLNCGLKPAVTVQTFTDTLAKRIR